MSCLPAIAHLLLLVFVGFFLTVSATRLVRRRGIDFKAKRSLVSARPFIFSTAANLIIAAAVSFLWRFVEGRPVEELGFQLGRQSALFSALAVVATAISAVVFLCLVGGRLQKPSAAPGVMFVAFISLALGAFQEELMFRAYFIQELLRPVLVSN